MEAEGPETAAAEVELDCAGEVSRQVHWEFPDMSLSHHQRGVIFDNLLIVDRWCDGKPVAEDTQATNASSCFVKNFS